MTDERLLLEIRAGSRSAFETLFDRYREPMWRFFRRRVPETARAEELAQEVFVAVLDGASRYEPRSSGRAYLFGIAFNLLKADHRRRARDGTTILEFDPPARLPDPDARLWIHGALAALDAIDRDILMLREFEQLTYDEIATLLRIPLNTVRSRLFRARVALKEALTREGLAEARVSHENR